MVNYSVYIYMTVSLCVGLTAENYFLIFSFRHPRSSILRWVVNGIRIIRRTLTEMMGAVRTVEASLS